MIDVTQHVLTPRRVAMQQTLGAYVRASMLAEQMEDTMWDGMLCRLTAQVLTDQNLHGTTTAELKVPASWWQHLKRDHLPRWFVNWRPVRMSVARAVIKCEHFRMFPMADFVPERFGMPVIYEQFTPGPWIQHDLRD